MPEAKRFAVLAEGTELLADSVAALEADACTLGNARHHRGAAVLRCFAEEEAAKVLILMDLARAGWRNHAAVKTGLYSFYDHLARGLYVKAYDGSPADLAEVRRYVDFWRQQYYLDGPMDVDWIFGNEVISGREERLYVDYIEDENGNRRWTGPADRAAAFDEPYQTAPPTSVAVRLVAAMHDIGLLTEEGLAATRSVWDGVEADDSMHWSDLHPLNVAVIEKSIENRKQPISEAKWDSARYVCERWIFPMTSLDLKMAEVNLADLEAQRERWLAREMGVADEMGDYGTY
ncbi:hypothetical protein K7640_09185 [Micromonospora sp. PLK6-60]|uniref:hypothetical protein n=1 Tax=Micromonospora sp. PLK6-60 TaxID=2873383 RepID=UPI001CA6B96B|nr:hypothetical protein [Micromonospora sp. PLK6-60]MBY8872013.1 hypothetical protein [Micromonospora sp. PLK6-60]